MHNPMAMPDWPIMVTGASSGIGRETAILLSQLGAKLFLVGRDRNRLDETLLRLEGDARGHQADVFDLSTGDAILPWFQDVVKRFGPFRGLAHCAGVQSFHPLRILSSATLERMYRINTISAAMLTRAFQQPAAHQRPASIVLVASTAANLAVPANAGYGASKAAVLSMTRSFAIELVDKGIRVNAVVPGLTDTEMVQRAREGMTEELFQGMVDKHPLGLGQPRDVANTIGFLLADTSRWVTGTSIVVDGGLSAP